MSKTSLVDAEAIVDAPGESSELSTLVNREGPSSESGLLASTRGEFNPEAQKAKMGTFMGVFVPTVTSVFGVIIFERMGWVLGNAGIYEILAMFFIAYTVVLLTVTSIAAIATNGLVKGGGAYYLVSRSLGPEFGGAIGVVYYLANVAGCCFYLLGFVEAFAEITKDKLPDGRWWHFLYASVALVLLTIVCMIGAGAFAKASFAILIVLVLVIIIAVVSFFIQPALPEVGFTGMSGVTFKSNLGAGYAEGQSFRTVFGILFPTFTGIMAGSNMSGDLRDPGKSIPLGTFAAAGFTGSVYLVLVFLFAFSVVRTCPGEACGLIGDYLIVESVCIRGWIVTVGIFAATLSSALAVIAGGARILQSLAKDNIIPILKVFAKGSGKNNEPRIGILFTYALIQLLLIVGNLNAIAPFITMFYLLLFGAINFATFLLTVSGAPNFRPKYKYFSWVTALIGFISAMVIMFVVSPLSAGISTVVVICIWFYVHFFAPPTTWGDISQALIFHQVRKYLLRLDSQRSHIKFWRPQFLHISSNPRSSIRLIDFVNSLKKGGLYVIGHILPGEPNADSVEHWRATQNNWSELIRTAKFKAFSETVIAPTVLKGAQELMMLSGLGAFTPNTVLIGFHTPEEREAVDLSLSATPQVTEALAAFGPIAEASPLSVQDYVEILRQASLLGKSLIIARGFKNLNKERMQLTRKQLMTPGSKQLKTTVDVWALVDEDWSKAEETLSYQFMLGNLLCTSSWWKRHTVLRICSFTEQASMVPMRKKQLEEVLDIFRIQADVEVWSLEEKNLEHYRTYVAAAHKAASKDESEELAAGIYGSMAMHERLECINELINSVCRRTSVCLLPLSLPPPADSERSNEYLKLLDSLTKGLPPTMMIHGHKPVLTTEI